jgi:hypothetical protein
VAGRAVDVLRECTEVHRRSALDRADSRTGRLVALVAQGIDSAAGRAQRESAMSASNASVTHVDVIDVATLELERFQQAVQVRFTRHVIASSKELLPPYSVLARCHGLMYY